MAYFINGYPYSDTHNLNLDWVIDTLKRIETEMGQLHDGLEIHVTDTIGTEIYTFTVKANGIYITRPDGGTPFFYNFDTQTLYASKFDGQQFLTASGRTTGQFRAGSLVLDNALPIAQGGTGATDAAAARNALGAVNKAGDTMTGPLSVPGINALGNYPGMTFRQAAGADPVGFISEGVASRQMAFTVVPSDAGGNEAYNLPVPSAGNTGLRNFNILTTKDWLVPVNVTTGVSRVTVQYNNSLKFLNKLVVVNVRLLIAAGTAIPVNSGVCNVQQQAYTPEFPGDTSTYATISAAPYGPFKISPNGTVTATEVIPADYTGTITMSGVFFAA